MPGKVSGLRRCGNCVEMETVEERKLCQGAVGCSGGVASFEMVRTASPQACVENASNMFKT